VKKVRKYVKIDDVYYELSDIELRDEPIQNIYFWKWFGKECKIVYKEVDITKLSFLNENEIPVNKIPVPHEYKETLWDKIKNLFKLRKKI